MILVACRPPKKLIINIIKYVQNFLWFGGEIFVYKSMNGEYVYYYILELDDITNQFFIYCLISKKLSLVFRTALFVCIFIGCQTTILYFLMKQ